MAMMTRRWSEVAKKKYSRVDLYKLGIISEPLEGMVPLAPLDPS